MAFTSIGYDGTVNERQWAELVPSVGSSTYGVKEADDLKVTAVPGQPLVVAVASGTAWGHGVMDTETSNTTIQCDPITTGSRWDLIALRRNWQPLAGGPTAAIKITGTAEKVIPSTRQAAPGEVDDQPLALVQWTAGQTQPSAIVDLRCWGGNSGMYANDDLVRTYLNSVGTAITIGAVRWQRVLGGNDVAVWVSDTGLESISMLTLGGWTIAGDVTRERLPSGKYRYTASAIVVRTAGNVAINRGALKLGQIIPSGWTPADRVDCHAGLNNNFNNYIGAFNLRLWDDGHFSTLSSYGDLTLVQYGNFNFAGTWVK